ncbi:hypothetical protein EJD97_016903 [Solanum chilense]|uniref:Uncharacterized protein n=1 Tax=Solanum chilense TaxID=4083 RepID=A0A6N2B431_SOLCI|nr:hypothetical protein EJD97_016903 [Solanum chilense]
MAMILSIFLFSMQAQSSDQYSHGKSTMLRDHLIPNRKITTNGKRISQDAGELREAPMSPDPLHHHGGLPRNIMP